MAKYLLRAGIEPAFRVPYEKELNPQQLEVVRVEGGPLLVIAGAGSGKTRALTYRVARLVESGIAPERILLMTFTNKAAREMIHRVELLLGEEVRRIWGGTFHHIGNLVLRRHAPLLGWEPNFTILDRGDAKEVWDACVVEAGIDVKRQRFPKGDVLATIHSLGVNTERPLAEIVLQRYPFFYPLLPEIARVAEAYAARKRAMSVVDYDDLLVGLRDLLCDQPEILALYAQRFLHVLVDEYQDTNALQGEIVDQIASHHRNLTVVGDDSQSIYSFRGASFANIITFPERYPDCRILKLETNYRSCPPILELANASIRNNPRQFPKALTAVRGGGGRPALVPLRDERQQAQFVAQRVLELRDEGAPLAEIAVLYRSHYQSLEVQLELQRRGIPYAVRSGLRFFEQAHIKDVVAYLRAVTNPRDEQAWRRLWGLLPHVGRATAHRLWEALRAAPDILTAVGSPDLERLVPPRAGEDWARQVALLRRLAAPALAASPGGAIQEILQSGYADHLRASFANAEARLEDLNQLASFGLPFTSTEEFLAQLALLGTVEAEDVVHGGPEDERMTLSTIHQAKGLEWRVVLLIGADDSGLPSRRALRDPEGEEEERRLFYVAVTRSKDELYLCYPQVVGIRSHVAQIQRPSRFIQELPEETYETWEVEEALGWR